jgi:hypothetical protein
VNADASPSLPPGKPLPFGKCQLPHRVIHRCRIPIRMELPTVRSCRRNGELPRSNGYSTRCHFNDSAHLPAFASQTVWHAAEKPNDSDSRRESTPPARQPRGKSSAWVTHTARQELRARWVRSAAPGRTREHRTAYAAAAGGRSIPARAARIRLATGFSFTEAPIPQSTRLRGA